MSNPTVSTNTTLRNSAVVIKAVEKKSGYLLIVLASDGELYEINSNGTQKITTKSLRCKGTFNSRVCYFDVASDGNDGYHLAAQLFKRNPDPAGNLYDNADLRQVYLRSGKDWLFLNAGIPNYMPQPSDLSTDVTPVEEQILSHAYPRRATNKWLWLGTSPDGKKTALYSTFTGYGQTGGRHTAGFWDLDQQPPQFTKIQALHEQQDLAQTTARVQNKTVVLARAGGGGSGIRAYSLTPPNERTDKVTELDCLDISSSDHWIVAGKLSMNDARTRLRLSTLALIDLAFPNKPIQFPNRGSKVVDEYKLADCAILSAGKNADVLAYDANTQELVQFSVTEGQVKTTSLLQQATACYTCCSAADGTQHIFARAVDGDISHFVRTKGQEAWEIKEIIGLLNNVTATAASNLREHLKIEQKGVSLVKGFLTEVTFRNREGQLLADQEVKIISAQQKKLRVNHGDLEVDKSGAIAKTDAQGKLLISEETDAIGTGAFQIRYPSDDALSYFRIDPSAAISTRLKNITANELTNAKVPSTDKKGTAEDLLPPEYQGEEQTKPAAEAIRQIIELTSSSSNQKKRQIGGIADDDTVTQIDARYGQQDDDGRIILQDNQLQQGLGFAFEKPTEKRNSTDKPIRSLSSKEIEGLVQTAVESAKKRSITLDFEQLWNDVLQGTKTVVEYAFTRVKSSVELIVRCLDGIWKVVVDFTAQLYTVVTHIFQKLGVALEKAWRWLAFAFNWEDITLIKNTLKDILNDSFDSGVALTEHISLVARKGFAATREQIKSALSTMKEPSDAKALGVKTSELASRFDTVYHKTESYNVFRQIATAPAFHESTKRSVETVEFDNSAHLTPLIKAVDTLIDQLQDHAVLKRFEEKVSSSLESFIQNPIAFLRELQDVLVDLLINIAGGVIDLAEQLVVSIVKLVGSALGGLKKFLNSTVTIPFLSDAYKLLTGEPLTNFTYIDVITLSIAIPASFLHKGIFGEAMFKDESAGTAFRGAITNIFRPSKKRALQESALQARPFLMPKSIRAICATLNSICSMISVGGMYLRVLGPVSTMRSGVDLLAYVFRLGCARYTLTSYPAVSQLTYGGYPQWLVSAIHDIFFFMNRGRAVPATSLSALSLGLLSQGTNISWWLWNDPSAYGRTDDNAAYLLSMCHFLNPIGEFLSCIPRIEGVGVAASAVITTLAEVSYSTAIFLWARLDIPDPQPILDRSDWMTQLFKSYREKLNKAFTWDGGQHRNEAYAAALNAITLSHLAIPGTHDSGCFGADLEAVSKTQYFDFKRQLETGIRKFDIRPGRKEGEWYMHHNGLYTEDMKLEPQLEAINDFSANHPKEIILLYLTDYRDLDAKQAGGKDITRELFDFVYNKIGSKVYLTRTPSSARERGKDFSVTALTEEQKPIIVIAANGKSHYAKDDSGLYYFDIGDKEGVSYSAYNNGMGYTSANIWGPADPNGELFTLTGRLRRFNGTYTFASASDKSVEGVITEWKDNQTNLLCSLETQMSTPNIAYSAYHLNCLMMKKLKEIEGISLSLETTTTPNPQPEPTSADDVETKTVSSKNRVTITTTTTRSSDPAKIVATTTTTIKIPNGPNVTGWDFPETAIIDELIRMNYRRLGLDPPAYLTSIEP